MSKAPKPPVWQGKTAAIGSASEKSSINDITEFLPITSSPDIPRLFGNRDGNTLSFDAVPPFDEDGNGENRDCPDGDTAAMPSIDEQAEEAVGVENISPNSENVNELDTAPLDSLLTAPICEIGAVNPSGEPTVKAKDHEEDDEKEGGIPSDDGEGIEDNSGESIEAPSINQDSNYSQTPEDSEDSDFPDDPDDFGGDDYLDDGDEERTSDNPNADIVMADEDDAGEPETFDISYDAADNGDDNDDDEFDIDDEDAVTGEGAFREEPSAASMASNAELSPLNTKAPKKTVADFFPYILGTIVGTAAGSLVHWFLNDGRLPMSVVAIQFCVALLVMLVLFIVLSQKDKRRREDIGEAVSAYDEELTDVKEQDPALYAKLANPDTLTDEQLNAAMTELGQKFPDAFAALIETQETITGFESEIEVPEAPADDVADFARGSMAESPDSSDHSGGTEVIGSGGAVKRGETGEFAPVADSRDYPCGSASALDELELALWEIPDERKTVAGQAFDVVAKGKMDGLGAEILLGTDGEISLALEGEIVGSCPDAAELADTIGDRDQTWEGRTAEGQHIVSLLGKKKTRGFYAVQIAKARDEGRDLDDRLPDLYEKVFGESFE